MPIPRYLIEQAPQQHHPLRRMRGFRHRAAVHDDLGPGQMLVDRDPRLGGPLREVVQVDPFVQGLVRVAEHVERRQNPNYGGDPIEQWQRFERWALRLSLQGVRLQEGKMVKTKEEIQAARRKADASHARALDSFRRLIADVLASDDPVRFAEAARICAAAHGLITARASRVGELGEAVGGDQFNIMNALQNVPVMAQNAPRYMGQQFAYDGAQAQRDALVAGAMVQDAEARKRDAEASCAETLELSRLSEMAETLTKAISAAGIEDRAAVLRRRLGAVEARIDQLTTRMEGRASAAREDPKPGKDAGEAEPASQTRAAPAPPEGEDDADVVPADEPGRHQPAGRGAGGRAAHRADGQGAVAD